MAARIALLRGFLSCPSKSVSRNIHSTAPVSFDQDWRYSRGISRNPNASGPLTDNCDFSFVDGRPTPLGKGQKRRIVLNQLRAEKILQSVKEMDFAVERFQQITKQTEEQRKSIVEGRLKAKGHHALKKKTDSS